MSLDILNGLIDDVIAVQTVDMTEESTGGGGELMPEGFAMARLVTYIELGLQPQEFGGKAKAPATEVILGFKLFGAEPDSPYNGRFLSTFPMAIGNNTKSNAKIVFNRMNWDGQMRHFAQALGKGFLVPVTVYTNEKTKKQSNRLNLKDIRPPFDAVSRQTYPIPEVTAEDLKYFFFDRPTKETWDSLFVEGSYDDGGSKNKFQEKILTALNFPGSVLEQLISGVVLPDPGSVQAVPASDSAQPEQAPVNVPAPAVAPAIGPAAAPVMPTMPPMPQ